MISDKFIIKYILINIMKVANNQLLKLIQAVLLFKYIIIHN